MNAADIRKLADYADAQSTRGAPPIAEALRALADVVEAGNDEHGKRDREPECNLCQALARVEALSP